MKKYPDYIMQMLRQRLGRDQDDDTADVVIMSMSPSKVFESLLEWEGICGYKSKILDWIRVAYGVELNRLTENLSADERKQDRADFVRGFGNIVANFPLYYACGVKKCELDEESDVVTIYFEGGGTKRVSIFADSYTAAMTDMISGMH